MAIVTRPQPSPESSFLYTSFLYTSFLYTSFLYTSFLYTMWPGRRRGKILRLSSRRGDHRSISFLLAPPAETWEGALSSRSVDLFSYIEKLPLRIPEVPKPGDWPQFRAVA